MGLGLLGMSLQGGAWSGGQDKMTGQEFQTLRLSHGAEGSTNGGLSG